MVFRRHCGGLALRSRNSLAFFAASDTKNLVKNKLCRLSLRLRVIFPSFTFFSEKIYKILSIQAVLLFVNLPWCKTEAERRLDCAFHIRKNSMHFCGMLYWNTKFGAQKQEFALNGQEGVVVTRPSGYIRSISGAHLHPVLWSQRHNNRQHEGKHFTSN